MKRILLKLVSLVCVLSMLFVGLCSCAEKKDNVVLKYTSGSKVEGSLDRSFMYFWISMQKSMYNSIAQSSADGWQSVVDGDKGTTLSDLLMTESAESAKKLLAIEYLHDKVYKITLTDEQKDSVASQVEKLAQNYGSKEKLDTVLSQFGANSDTLKRYFELVLKQNDLYDYLYGENGTSVISEEAKKQYFIENYSIVSHIFFSTAGTQKDDGTTVSMPEEQVEEKRQTAKQVYEAVKNGGADFTELQTQYNEDAAASQYYPYGFFVTNDSTFPTEFTTNAINLAVGDYAYVETPNVGIHVLKKLEMNSDYYNAYEDVYKTITDTLSSEDFNKKLADYTVNVNVNEKLMEQFDTEKIPVFSLGNGQTGSDGSVGGSYAEK